MLAELFVALCRVPYLKKRLWGGWYEFLAGNYRAPEWTFMNYGFEDASAQRLELQGADEPDRQFIQLYNYVAGAVDLTNRNVLEVGCGRGGGASFVAGYLRPSRMTGVDLSEKAVEFCRKRHVVQNLEFRAGDAEHLPFADKTFDAVINVESSHCYPSLPSFYAEVRRVLKPGGHFLYADLRDSATVKEWRETLSASGLSIVQETEITKFVLAGLDRNNEQKRELIQRLVPGVLQAPFSDFAGMRGSKVYEGFRSGSLTYRSFVATRP